MAAKHAQARQCIQRRWLAAISTELFRRLPCNSATQFSYQSRSRNSP